MTSSKQVFHAAAFSPDERLVASGGNLSVALCDARSGQLIRVITAQAVGNQRRPLSSVLIYRIAVRADLASRTRRVRAGLASQKTRM